MASISRLGSHAPQAPVEQGVRRRQCAWLITCATLVAVTLAGCGSLETSAPEIRSVETDSNQRLSNNLWRRYLTSKQSSVRLKLPRNWQPVPNNNFHPLAELQAYNPQREIFLIVLSEDQNSVTAAGNLTQQAEIYLQLLKNNLNQLISMENLTDVKSVSGFDAVQYDLSGEVYGTQVAYLHTTVAMNNRYYQIVAWTPNDRFSDNVDEMKAIVQAVEPD